MGLLMSVGFLHSNGNCPDNLVQACSSDRPRSDRPVPKAPEVSLPARQQLATSPCGSLPLPCSFQAPLPLDRQFDENPQPTDHASTHPRTHALIIFETRQICSTASLAASSDHHQCFCCIVFFVSRPSSRRTRRGRRSWTLARP